MPLVLRFRLSAVAGPHMRNSVAIWQQVNEATYGFLTVEADIGLTFAKSAVNAISTQECLRHRRLARRAYNTAEKIMTKAALTPGEAKILVQKMQLLKRLLSRLGDPQCVCKLTPDSHFADSSRLVKRSQL